MLYAIFCYNREEVVGAWSEEKDAAVMAHHAAVEKRLAASGQVGPVVRLMPTTTATTVRAARHPLVFDGPFAETKEQLLGFYVVDCSSLDEAISIAGELSHEPGSMEIRPIQHFSDLSNPSADRLRSTSQKADMASIAIRDTR
jgi:hypothetical protein